MLCKIDGGEWHTHSRIGRKIDVLDKSRLNQFLLRPKPLVQAYIPSALHKHCSYSTINSIYPSGFDSKRFRATKDLWQRNEVILVRCTKTYTYFWIADCILLCIRPGESRHCVVHSPLYTSAICNPLGRVAGKRFYCAENMHLFIFDDCMHAFGMLIGLVYVLHIAETFSNKSITYGN